MSNTTMDYTFLTEKYSREKFIYFLGQSFDYETHTSPVTKEEKDYVLTEVGVVNLVGCKKLAVFEVQTSSSTNIENNRVGLRNIVLQQIIEAASDGALAVYFDPDKNTWRFSFISFIPHFDSAGNLQIKKPDSKRYTFLLGLGRKTTNFITQLNTLPLKGKHSITDIQTVFEVEPLNKEFYDKIFNWYRRAQKEAIFPNEEHISGKPTDQNNHTSVSLIRLLTRLLFIWFLKQKGLVNTKFFDETEVKNIINYDKSSSYYKAILQNLFFATLNREIKDREFQSTTKGKSNEEKYLVPNVFHYQDYFKETDKKAILDLFNQTPFLNGGLFECLDRKASAEENINYDQDNSIRPHRIEIRMEGFSDREDNSLKVPNDLFFNDKPKELGLIDILNQYQFTTIESTSSNIEVALDPELLGRVFEGLLATYNLDTQDKVSKVSKGKATGSYYTPRYIVDYMVNQSLKQYIIQNVVPSDKNIDFFEERITDLFDLVEKGNVLPENTDDFVISDEEIEPLIKALSNIKVLDPAVGSGAFSMGMLQKITALLALLDPDNEQWKSEQLTKLPSLKNISQDIEISKKIKNSEASKQAQKILEQQEQAVLKIFDKQNHSYSRKLFLIENCIYGVDIQSIAITIAKLRFFISLAIEQTTNNDPRDNYGITPLPNLETKLIVADSLLSLQVEFGVWDLFTSDIEIQEKKESLKLTRSNYFSETLSEKKKDYIEKDHEIRKAIGAILSDMSTADKELSKITAWDPYNPSHCADWFDPEWMFGITNGFDIVIGNPPYISFKKDKTGLKEKYRGEGYYGFQNNGDIYVLFYELGHKLLNENGALCFITSNSWLRSPHGDNLRNYLVNNSQPLLLIDLGDSVFKAKVNTNILLFTKDSVKKPIKVNTILSDQHKYINSLNNFTQIPVFKETEKWLIPNSHDIAIDKKIQEMGKPLNDHEGLRIRMGIITAHVDAFIINEGTYKKLIQKNNKNKEILKPCLKGEDIHPYQGKWAKKWMIHTHNGVKGKISPVEITDYPAIKVYLDKFWSELESRGAKGVTPYNLRTCSFFPELEGEKILFSDISGEARFYLDTDKYLIDNSAYVIFGEDLRFKVALLNSKLMSYAFGRIYAGSDFGKKTRYQKEPLSKLPIPVQVSKTVQQPFIDLVDKIHAEKARKKDTVELQNQIDVLVYKYYGLTEEEIKIVDPNYKSVDVSKA